MPGLKGCRIRSASTAELLLYGAGREADSVEKESFERQQVARFERRPNGRRPSAWLRRRSARIPRPL